MPLNRRWTLVGAARRLAFDRTLPPAEALGRIRDHFRCNAMARRDDYIIGNGRALAPGV
jgi:hypothetical protein